MGTQTAEKDLSESTACSTVQNSVQDCLTNDKVRYQRKGYGLICAILITVAYFTIYPKLLLAFWPTMLSISEDRRIQHALFSLVYPYVIFIVSNLVMWYIYVSKSEFFERYRIMDKQWPWEVDQKQWRKTLWHAIKRITTNSLLFVYPACIIDLLVMGTKCRWDIESFPSLFEILWQITFMMFCEDFSFYWGHRTLHTPYLYKRIHKIHHEFTNTVSIAAYYAHPLEYLFGNAIPMALGFILLGNKCHFATYMIWSALRTCETVDGHSGYEFSWSPFRLLPFSGSSEYHNYHHSHNVGTYASFFTIWDTVFGTNIDYFKYKQKKEKEQALQRMREDAKQKTQ